MESTMSSYLTIRTTKEVFSKIILGKLNVPMHDAGSDTIPFDSMEELAATSFAVSTFGGSGTQLQFARASEGTTMR